jgi:hypothetical protein
MAVLQLDTLIPGSWLGASHRYRIEWTSTNVIYSIDGVQVASHAIAISTPMRPLASDFDVNLPALSIDWLRLSPYATPCTFDSQIFDAGQSVTWNKATWSQDVPTGTSLGISVRTGDTAIPDGSWTGFTTLASSGAVIGGNSRYIQYRADLAATEHLSNSRITRHDARFSDQRWHSAAGG